MLCIVNALQNCIAESEGELGCIFPEISNDDVDDIITGTLELRYSLVAASVPGLDNLHLMPQFTIEFVNDSIIYNLSGIIVYEKGSNTPITVRVSLLVCVCVFVCAHVCVCSVCM